MELFGKNAQLKYKYSGNLSESFSSTDTFTLTFLQSTESLRRIRAPCWKQPTPVQSDEKSDLRYVPDQIRARIFTGVRVSVYAGKVQEKRDLQRREHRRAVRRFSWNEKTRSTNFLDALDWSIDVDFEWAGTRNFARERGPGG